MSSDFRPMSGAAVSAKELAALKYPLFASPKLDGIRCIIRHGMPYSRNLELIRNQFIVNALTGLPDLDGELVAGNPFREHDDDDVWARSNSAVMSADGEPEFTFYVFDLHMEGDYRTRLHTATKIVTEARNDYVVMLDQTLCFEPKTVTDLEEWAVSKGYEGLVLRDPKAAYKYGKATRKQAAFLKLKRFEDYEARVTGFQALQRNNNPQETRNTGLVKRGKSKAGLQADNLLGALEGTMITGPYAGNQVKVGSGFKEKEKWDIWANQAGTLDRIFTFKCQGFTPDGAPRFPVFLHWRDKADMDAGV